MDACVLYPAPLRDFLLELSASGIFRARWSELIHDEWIRNLLKNRPDLTAEQLTRTKTMMNAAVEGCLVSGHEALISSLQLPDEDGRHVLAAAIHSGSDAIVTMNLRDFPSVELDKYEIEVLHPDEFLFQQFSLDPAAVIVAAQQCRARLKNPPKSTDDYLGILEAQSLPSLVAELRPYADLI
ncbi:MAG: PIN domain-containing protein [Candidatus Devosia phytovorans]|uniref:PIN domain-containing protein n=1 Tax=Candidatus Devosia phytovorans TaxID=3121372 RepID=A0AAJ6B1I5_9HYPH|nr:PIN domain-containing protein [Devosia sp.]WEK06845.1 MAG: PIN domain-containing protein [Devosia sp.]